MEMGGEILVNEGAGRGEEAFDPPPVVAIDNAVRADPQPVKAFKFIAQDFDVTGGKREDGSLHCPPGLRGKVTLILAHLFGNDDLSRQGWKRGGT